LLFVPRRFLDPWHEHRDGDGPDWKHALLSYRLLYSGCFSRAGEQLLHPPDPWHTPPPLLNPLHQEIPLPQEPEELRRLRKQHNMLGEYSLVLGMEWGTGKPEGGQARQREKGETKGGPQQA
jgi:hypothetical protein